MSQIYRITKNLSFEDAKKLSPKEVIKIQFRDWVFTPSELLIKTGNTDDLMGALIILLTFFEVHGQYLNGEDSNGKSGEFFRHAFDEYSNFSNIDSNLSSKFWKFARCGLFHSLTMKGAIMIDSVGYCGNKILKKWSDSNGEKIIVNVERLFGSVISYHEEYLNRLDLNDENFNKTYNRIIGDFINVDED